LEPPGGTAPAARGGDIGGVRLGDRFERGVVGQPGGEGFEERRDLGVGAASELAERVYGGVDCGRRAAVLVGGYVQNLPARRVDQHMIARLVGGGQFVRHHGNPVAAVDDRLAWFEPVEAVHGMPAYA